MKKQALFIIITIFTFTAFSFGQNTILPHLGGSENLEHYPRTNPEERPRIKNAWLPNGQQIIYNGNGYREYKMGNDIRRYHYNDGDCDGLVMFFDTTKTRVKELGYYYGNVKDGPWITFHKNGQISSIITYKNNKAISDLRTFHENANIESIIEVDSNGKKDGNYVEYYDDGSIHTKGQFDLVFCDSSKIDVTMWNPYDGNPVALKSIPVGDWTEYYPNGNTKKKMYYLRKCELITETDSEDMWMFYLIHKSCPGGTWKEYDENGNLVKTVAYKNCKMIKEEE